MLRSQISSAPCTSARRASPARTNITLRPGDSTAPSLREAGSMDRSISVKLHSQTDRASSSQALLEQSAGASTSRSVPFDDFETDSRPVILYDGVCNLCNGAVNLMLDLDPEGRFRMAALQSKAGMRLLQSCGRSADDISSIVLVEPGRRHHIKSEAVLRIAHGLPNGFPLLAWFGFPVPLFIRDSIYNLVADNRYGILGKRDVCRLNDSRFTERFIVE